MLQKLSIHNYAIIDDLEIHFVNGLNIITGETGAGKSILVGALSLILGERADSSTLKQDSKKCVVEAIFSIDKNTAILQFLDNNNLDKNEEILIRREIAAAGRSRAFINDTPVTITQLREFSYLLVDLHQQFDTLQLGDTDFQRRVIDALAKNDTLLSEYAYAFKSLEQAKKKLQTLENQKNTFNKEFDYFQFQYNELSEAALKENELEEADKELQFLSHSEEIKSLLTETEMVLQSGEQPIIQQLKQLSNKIHQYEGFHTNIPIIHSRLQSVIVELKDIAGETESLNDNIAFDNEKMDLLNDRLSVGYKLLKKHNVHTTNELLEIQSSLSKKLEAVLNIDEEITVLEKEVKSLQNTANSLAEKLSQERNKQLAPFAYNTNKLLVQVGMPNAKLKPEITSLIELDPTGKDSIEFLFDANKSNRFEPIRKVASGGELSRLMLCIKSLIAQSVELPTLIFDEIDSGISGEAAKQVGIIMKDLAKNRQVISITHQPQIAGKADAHFFVYKQEDEKSKTIRTNVRQLNKEERIKTIARMMGGENPSLAALENAKEMIDK